MLEISTTPSGVRLDPHFNASILLYRCLESLYSQNSINSRSPLIEISVVLFDDRSCCHHGGLGQEFTSLLLQHLYQCNLYMYMYMYIYWVFGLLI